MSLPYIETWGGVTPPTVPAAWNSGSASYATTTAANGITPTDSANMAAFPGGLSGPWFLTYGTADGVGGDVTVTSKMNMWAAGNPGVAGIFARGSSATMSSPDTYYAFYINWNTGEVFLTSVITGSSTTLASVTPIGGVVGWVEAAFSLNGTSLTVTLQRLSDGYWLTSGGTWQSGSATVFTETSSSISGSGYGGLYAGVAGAAYDAYWGYWSLGAYGAAGAVGSFGVTEARDTATIVAHAPSAAMLGITEQRDSGTGDGSFKSSGSLGVVERRDVAMLSGSVETAILTRLERPDVATIVATWTAPAVLAAAEQPDFALLFADFRAATASATEHRDTAAIQATFKASATLGVAERRDVAAMPAQWRTSPIFTVVERHDVAAISAVVTASARLSVLERPDVAAMTPFAAVQANIGAVERRDLAAIHAFFIGPPPALAVLERPDISEIVGVVPALGYHVYCSPAVNLPIDYSTIVATTGLTTWTSTALACPGTWMFGVRAFDANGEEQNLDCSVTITLDANGNDISNRPLPPTGLRAFATAGGGIRAEWWYPQVSGPMAPTGFNLYCGPAPTLSYAVPAATIQYAAGFANSFASNISGLTNGVPYIIGVRAFNVVAEEKNLATVTCTADSTGPGPVQSLTAIAVV